MELKFPEIKIEASENFKTKSFGFGDKRVIINILRSKMYSDPIYIICQEIMSNSRDAHREVGEDKKPVKVILPTKFDETIHFVDWGPGINKDRMENVFILYGESTKRGDNVQTGGFGLGCKTPFAYTDSFNITTITQEGDKRYRRQYSAYIDETQIGAMSLLIETETDEHTGTTISIPVKTADIRTFEDNILKVSRFWKVRPELKNSKRSWPTEQIEFEGTNWTLANGNGGSSSYQYYGYNSGNPLVIIDGVQYPLKTDLVAKKANGDAATQLARRSIRLFFNTGELQVTANREDLDYQPEVIDKIVKRLNECVEELREKMNATVVNATCLRDAISSWEKAKSMYRHLGITPKWKGLDLVSEKSFGGYSSSRQGTIYVYERQPTGTGGTVKFKAYRQRRYGSHPIKVRHDWVLVEHDTDSERPHIRRIRTLFIDNPIAAYVGIVKFKDDAAKTAWEGTFNWSMLKPTMLSTVAKAKIVRSGPPKGSRAKIVPVKELTSRRSSRTGTVLEWKNADNKAVTDAGIYVKLYGGDAFLVDKAGKETIVSKDNLERISKTLDIEVWGVLSRSVKKLGSQWVDVHTHVCIEIAKLEADQGVKDYILLGKKHSLRNYGEDFWKFLLKREANIADATGVFAQYLAESKKSDAGKEKLERLHKLQSAINLERVAIKCAAMKKLKEQFCQTYPLANAVIRGFYNDVLYEDVADGIIDYVNAKDKE